MNIYQDYSTAVEQYSLSGQFIKSYYSLYEAERSTGITVNQIKSCCNKTQLSAGHFQWIYKGDNPPGVCASSHYRPICQFRLDNKYIRTFASLHDAEYILGLNRQQIAKCCQGERESYGGYVFKYMSDTNLDIPVEDMIKRKPREEVKIPQKKKFEKLRMQRKAQERQKELEKQKKERKKQREKEKREKLRIQKQIAKQKQKEKEQELKLLKRKRERIKKMRPSELLKKYYEKYSIKDSQFHRITKKEKELLEAVEHENKIVVLQNNKIYHIYDSKCDAMEQLSFSKDKLEDLLYEQIASNDGFEYKFYFMVDEDLIKDYCSKEGE